MKTIEWINRKIKEGDAVVCTAEEIIDLKKAHGVKKAAEMVDVVTTATFGPMCSSGAFLNFGHSEPPIRMGKTLLNEVEAYSGIAAVDTYIGATQPSNDRGIQYGGAHVICDLIAGKSVSLKARSQGTDCYPTQELDAEISLDTINEAYLFNPRNAYQNYAAATNSSDRDLRTYMGRLLPEYENVTYSTCGSLSPLLNDPYLRTIGIGTRIFLAGAQGYVTWQGTQYFTGRARNDHGVPVGPSASIAVIGDMKAMDSQFIQPAVFPGYGVSLCLGIGIPIPILDEEMMRCVCIDNEEIQTNILDYACPSSSRPVAARVNYAQLRSGSVHIQGKLSRTQPLSNLIKARKIAELLKTQIQRSEFFLSDPVKAFPECTSLNTLEGIMIR